MRVIPFSLSILSLPVFPPFVKGSNSEGHQRIPIFETNHLLEGSKSLDPKAGERIRQISSEVAEPPRSINSAGSAGSNYTPFDENYSESSQVDSTLDENLNGITVECCKRGEVSCKASSPCCECGTFWVTFWVFWVIVYLVLEHATLRALYAH